MLEAKSLNMQSIKILRKKFFEQLSIDKKSEVKLEKRPLLAELKLKMVSDMIFIFSISALPLEVTFQMSL